VASCAKSSSPPAASCPVHRRFVYHERTSPHAEGTDPRRGLSERAGVRRHCGLLCSKLVAAESDTICIAVVSVYKGT